MNSSDYSWNLTHPAAIEINRSGALTEQQALLLRRFTPLPAIGCVVYLFVLGLAVIPFWFLLREPYVPQFVLLLYTLVFGGITLLILGYTFLYAGKAWIDRQDVRQGKVVGGYGEVIRTSRGYVARVADGKLRTLVQKVDLLPGKYYFYYLPRSRFLLSAESLEANPILGALELRQDLGRRFRFSEEELILNRNGRLSTQQRLKLFLQAVFFSLLFAIIAIVGPLMIYGIIRNENFKFFSIQVGLLVLLLLAFLGWVGWSCVPRLLDAFMGTNQIVVGPVQMQYRGSGRSSQLYYIVNGLEFQVNFKDYYSLVEGLIYQVHYTRWSKRIISIEPV
jgi:hypothetical protein